MTTHDEMLQLTLIESEADKRATEDEQATQTISNERALHTIVNGNALEKRAVWQEHWTQIGQLWRSEPEIDRERQKFLTQRRTITPDHERGIYPFREVRLNRADIEWLLATHEDGRGPVDWSEEQQRERRGLDLRGADLRRVNLQNLPLARLIGESDRQESFDLSIAQRKQAAIVLDEADLKGAHLEGARLAYAHMDRVDLRNTYLEQAILAKASLQGAFMSGAILKNTDFHAANLKGTLFWNTDLSEVRLRGANLEDAYLEGAKLVNGERIGPHLADAKLRNTNLSVVRWSEIKVLGDEHRALQKISNENVPEHAEKKGKQKEDRYRLWEYESAVRANRQLSVALHEQAMNEESSYFAYRAQVLQRTVLLRKKKFGQFLFSLLLDLLAGYGHRPGRSLVAYLLTLGIFATLYYLVGNSLHLTLSPLTALILSVTAFHGRGFFPGGISLDSPMTALAALEALIGLFIEISFIATFTQRFFSR
jgi:uncharacterized protein YjbI with pentapeptide repeats